MELNPIIKRILEIRGISSEEELEEFISEKPKKTYDPFLLKDMERGVDFILKAIEDGKKICIYGDYDADGISSTAVLYTVLSNLTDKLGYHIPSRFEDGYGLNIEAIDRIKEAGYDLIVTVDCGCTSKAEVEYANSIGLDVVVTDHHATGDDAPDCIFINPKQADCPYPFKELAGCGVAFKLAQGIQRKSGMSKAVLDEVLDLVSLGTIGDIMPLQDENRTIVKYGMKALKSRRRKAIAALTDKVNLKPENINSENVAFVIVPHINAAGRMKDATIACDMMISSDDKLIDEATDFLIQNNVERKRVQEEMALACESIVEREQKGDKILAVKPDFSHEGIAGIVAGKLKEKYYTPTIIVSKSGDMLKGTGRSIEGVNIHDLLDKHQELFEKFGGHALACGFTITEENFAKLVPLIKKDAEEIYKENPELFKRHYLAEMKIDVKDISLELAEQLRLLEPFGNKNPKPIFEIDTDDIRDIKYMGREEQHVKFRVGDVQAVLFSRAKEYRNLLEEGGKLRLMGCPDISEWNGNSYLQLMVYEIQR